MTPERLAEIREMMGGPTLPELRGAHPIEDAADDLLTALDAERLRADLACDAVETLQRTLEDVRRGLGCRPGEDVRAVAGRYAEACEALDVDPADNLAHRIRMAMESGAHRARIAEEAVVSLARATQERVECPACGYDITPTRAT
jgi:hypothetical protein